MRRHVDLLGILFIVSGALSLCLAVSLLALALGAAALVTSGRGEGADLVAGVTAATFLIVAVCVLMWGGAHVWTGSALRRHQPWARLVSLAMAVLNLILLPFGTALGIYTLWVLLNDQSRQLFEPPP